MENPRGRKRMRNESSSSRSDENLIESQSSDADTQVLEDETLPEPANSVFEEFGSSASETEEYTEPVVIDESISIICEKKRNSPDLRVEWDSFFNEVVIKFFLRDNKPYFGHFSKKVKIGQRIYKLSFSASIGNQNTSALESKSSQAESTVAASASNKQYTFKCRICFDDLDEILGSGRTLWSTVCGHLFCSVCVVRCRATMKQCPSCNKPLSKNDYHPICH